MRRVAVIGGGISGLGAAYELAKAGVHVVLYEKEDCLGGHAKTVNVDGLDLDLGFMVFNRVTFPHMTELFDSLGIDTEASDVSFSVSSDRGLGYEWGSRNGLRSLFAQKSNLLKPNFWKMLRELKKFKDDAIMYLEEHDNNPDLDHTESLGHFINSHSYSEFFQKVYLVPVCASIWSCSPDRVMDFSAFSVLSFFRSYQLLQLSGHPQWLTVRKRSDHYVKLREELEVRGNQIKTSCEVYSVSTSDNGCTLFYGNDSQDIYAGCIMAVPAPDVIKILGKEATYDEMRILGAFQYIYSDIFLHHDKSFKPQNPAAWSAWNFLNSTDGEAFLTYWLTVLQNISETSVPFLATVNPPHPPKNVMLKWSTGHLIPSVTSAKASCELSMLQGKRRIWFSEAHHGNGSCEDELKAGMIAAHAILGRSFTVLRNLTQMVSSWTEAAARSYVIRFLKHFISAGCLILLEEGGAALTFEGSDERCKWKSTLRVHNPKFYWKVASESDLGLADAFISGDISVVDKNEGLMNFFMVILANLYLYPSASEVEKRRRGSEGGWRPLLFTASIASVKYFYRHLSRRNTIAQARRNIAQHYNLTSSIPDERHDAHVRSSDFVKEYIFPGGCLSSLSRIASAMAAASRLCMEHVENIGVHYAQTLRCWRKRFLENQSKIRSLGFDEKFLKVWEYYFDYCASGFMTRTFMSYQIVFTRQGNLVAFRDHHASIPSVHSYP